MSGPDNFIPLQGKVETFGPYKPDGGQREAAALRSERMLFLSRARPVLIDYLRLKLDAEDWHGVQDAASDLRDLDSELDGLRY